MQKKLWKVGDFDTVFVSKIDVFFYMKKESENVHQSRPPGSKMRPQIDTNL